MDFDRLKTEIEHLAGVGVIRDEPLKSHTSLGVGGPAALFATVTDAEEACRVFEAANQSGVPLFVLGGGTNVLVSDDGFSGLVVLTAFDEIEISGDGKSVRAGASVKASRLVEFTVNGGFAGLEFAAGLPGSVGGAVAGNAGCFGSSFGERLQRAMLVHYDGSLEIVDAGYFNFAYRKSSIQGQNTIIVEADFSIEPGDRNNLRQIADEHLELRRTKHPSVNAMTAGSYFKNLPPLEQGGRRRAAGVLLDEVGAKSIRVGDAAVFEKHANIIVNRGNASARDVLQLEAKLKKMVFDKFGVELEPEVRFIGERPEGV